MPWRGPQAKGEFPTLGYAVAEWIEELCVIPDGAHAGEPFRLTEKQGEFLLWYYRLHPDARPSDRPSRALVYDRGGQLIAPQKWGKGPHAAAMVVGESAGPVVFDGWDAAGEPVGRPWPTPWVQVTAVSEAQTANVWRALIPMIELGPLSAVIPDIGETRINLRGGGRIERVTASARSRLGQRITFAVQDEEHDWNSRNGGRKLADNQRRNLAGMGGRWLATGNAWDPTEQSVAQQTYESKSPGVYKMLLDAGPGDIAKVRDRRRLLKALYGDCWWIDQGRIESEVLELIGRNEAAQAERFFFNRIRQSARHAYDLASWEARKADVDIAAGSTIVIAVDGARFSDAIAAVATDVVTGHQWPIGIWEAPLNPSEDYEHPLDEVDGAVTEAFEQYRVWRMYVDPQHIEGLHDRWQGRWGDKKVLAWWTNRPKQMAYAVHNHLEAVRSGELTHSGHPALTRHIGNAIRTPVNVYDENRRQMFVIAKEAPASQLKIDGATAAVMSFEARGDAIAAGEPIDVTPWIAFT